MTALFELLKQDAHVWDLYTARKEYGSDFTSHDAPVMTHDTQGALPEPAVSASVSYTHLTLPTNREV